MVEVQLPSIILEEVRRRGINLEDLLFNALTNVLKLDPREAAELRLKLAIEYLNEGKDLVDKDPIQASGELYKAVEEVVKALAHYYNLSDILANVNERGRWTVTELEKAVLVISGKIGGWFGEAWDRANYLHVWGFHEAKLGPEAVRVRLPYIEKMVQEAQRIISGP